MDLRSSDSIERKHLSEWKIIHTMGMVKYYPVQQSPFPTNPFTTRSEQQYFKISL